MKNLNPRGRRAEKAAGGPALRIDTDYSMGDIVQLSSPHGRRGIIVMKETRKTTR